MFYGYEVVAKILVIEDNLNDIQTTKCEAYETLEDIPLHMYDYCCFPDSITSYDIRNRIKIQSPMILEKSRKGRIKESTQSLLTPEEDEYRILTEE